MSKVFTIAWREFRQTVLRKLFLLAIIGLPLLLVVVMGLAVLMMMTHKEPPLIGSVAIADPTGEVAEAARHQFSDETEQRRREQEMQQTRQQAQDLLTGRSNRQGMAIGPPKSFTRGDVHIEVQGVQEVSDVELKALQERVREGDLLALVVVEPQLLALPGAEAQVEAVAGPRHSGETSSLLLYVSENLDSDHTGLIERRIADAIVQVRTRRAGLDPEQAAALLKRPRPDTRLLLPGGQEASEGRGMRELRGLVPMTFFLLLWIATFSAGQHLMMSTIEEKSNRVMEVLLSAVSPLQLMTGKILGQGAVGLVIVVIYASLGLAALVTLASMHLIELVDVAYLFIYFFMAYFMIASIMAAVGSAVSDIREANTLLTPVMLVLMFLWFLWLPISYAPNGVVATVFSFVPPAIPFAMVLRLAADEPVPGWQIPLTIAWGYFCVFGMVWLASRIFRVGVLMYGKPPSPLELLRWLRYS